MAVQLLCPNLKCRKILSVPSETRGKLVKCQYCQTMLRVPSPKPEAAGTTPAKSQD
jgi:LSD1 subclass zinc finger protein